MGAQCPRNSGVRNVHVIVGSWPKIRLLEWNIDKKLMTIVVDNAKKKMINHIIVYNALLVGDQVTFRYNECFFIS